MYVHPARGGVLCVRCRGEGRAYLASQPVLERLIAFQQVPFDGRDGERYRLAPGMAAEARALVRCFFAATDRPHRAPRARPLGARWARRPVRRKLHERGAADTGHVRFASSSRCVRCLRN